MVDLRSTAAYEAFVGDDFVYDTTDLNESASRIEVFAFGERIGLKAKDMTTLRTSSVVSLPWDRETLEWWLLLAALGVVSYGFARGAFVLVARRPLASGTAIVVAVTIAIPPVSWSGGGGGAVFYWELSDPLGTGMVLVDEDGARVRHKTFRPFGGEYDSVGSLLGERTYYAGHRRHDDSGLYYMQARWMDPNAGVFVSIDPLVPDAFDPQAVNAFAYARNNPINVVDPTGKCGIGPLGIASWGCMDPRAAETLGVSSGFTDSFSTGNSSFDTYGDGNVLSERALFGGYQTFALTGGQLNSVYEEWTISWYGESAPIGVAFTVGEMSQGGGGSIGAPGFAESLIPVWGSGRSAINNFQEGNYGWAAFDVAAAVSDVFLVGAVAKGVAKGAFKAGSNTWSATRKWYGQTRNLEKRTPVHHWAIERNSALGQQVPDVIKNQPWNLMPMRSQGFHNQVHGWGPDGFNAAGRLWYGTPSWAKAGALSTTGHGAEAYRAP